MKKIILLLIFNIHFLNAQEINIKYEIVYKNECLKFNDSIINIKENKTPYLKF
jgi:hypothetical protein